MRWPIALTALYALFVAVGISVWQESPVITEQPIVAWQMVTISGHGAVPDTEGGLSSVPFKAERSCAEQAPFPECPPSFGCAQPIGPVTPLPDLSVVPDFSQLREQEPVVVAASVLPPVEGALTRDAMVGLLSDAGWPEEVIPAALSVAWCESRWRPGAIGDGGRAIGLFQLHGPGVGWGGGDGWFSHFGVTVEQGRDARVNAEVALKTWQRSGWGPWSCRP